MSEPEAEAEPTSSLFRQRMALHRPKGLTIASIVIFGLGGLWWLCRAIFDGGEGFYWALGAAFLVVAVMHTLLLRSTLRKIQAFED